MNNDLIFNALWYVLWALFVIWMLIFSFREKSLFTAFIGCWVAWPQFFHDSTDDIVGIEGYINGSPLQYFLMMILTMVILLHFRGIVTTKKTLLKAYIYFSLSVFSLMLLILIFNLLQLL